MTQGDLRSEMVRRRIGLSTYVDRDKVEFIRDDDCGRDGEYVRERRG